MNPQVDISRGGGKEEREKALPGITKQTNPISSLSLLFTVLVVRLLLLLLWDGLN